MSPYWLPHYCHWAKQIHNVVVILWSARMASWVYRELWRLEIDSVQQGFPSSFVQLTTQAIGLCAQLPLMHANDLAWIRFRVTGNFHRSLCALWNDTRSIRACKTELLFLFLFFYFFFKFTQHSFSANSGCICWQHDVHDGSASREEKMHNMVEAGNSQNIKRAGPRGCQSPGVGWDAGAAPNLEKSDMTKARRQTSGKTSFQFYLSDTAVALKVYQSLKPWQYITWVPLANSEQTEVHSRLKYWKLGAAPAQRIAYPNKHAAVLSLISHCWHNQDFCLAPWHTFKGRLWLVRTYSLRPTTTVQHTQVQLNTAIHPQVWNISLT